MLTKSRIKLVKSLSRKRYRLEHRAYVVEGYKSIAELVALGQEFEDIYVCDSNAMLDHLPAVKISSREMSQISQMKSPPGYLAIFKMPQSSKKTFDSGKTIALDGVSDPGNMGTILRTADWYGIDQLICSEDCVDIYNPKTVQASMASIARVNVVNTNLVEVLENEMRPVFYADMQGENIYTNPLPEEAVVVMGSESHGVSKEIKNIANPISIPSFATHDNPESLNVAIAASIIVSEWLRVTGK